MELESHEDYCGSRTEKCDECGDFVMLKDWEKHQSMTLYHELAKKPCKEVFGYDSFEAQPSRRFEPVMESPIARWRKTSEGAAFANGVLNHTSKAPLNSPESNKPRRKYSASIIDRIKAENVEQDKKVGFDLPKSVSMNEFELPSDNEFPRPPRKSATSTTLFEDFEAELPCEFCDELFPMFKLTKHQLECTKNIDSLYFNSHNNHVLPEVVTKAFTEDKDIERVPTSRLIDVDDGIPPPLPPKTTKKNEMSLDLGETGARPKLVTSNESKSIVGKYLENGAKPKKSLKKYPAPKPPSPDGIEFEAKSHIEAPKSVLKEPQKSVFIAPHPRSPFDKPKNALNYEPRSTAYKRFDMQIRKTSLPESPIDEKLPQNLKPKRKVSFTNDNEEREKLREMLSGLRKDPFDEDLENNDGSFFPCEFCGDPYPVEFIMRHQLSCDLNPSPVTSGQGFDYSLIRSRAEQNLELAKL